MKLPSLSRSFLSVLFDCVAHKKVSEDVFRVLIVTIKASDLLLHGDEDKLPQEEFHRFLLLLPYLLSQFTTSDQQNVNQSLSAFQNKRSIVQLLKKSLPSISIGNKSRILQILDVIQREVDQDDPALI